MNSELLKKMAQQLLKKQDLYSWLQLYSVQTWNKIGFVSNRKLLKINETTITQNLVFDFWQLAAASKLPVELYESKNEKANGNDLEIVVETSKGFLLFPCQAKIIQKNNRYNTIHHKNKSSSVYQMDMLLNYANQHSGIPIYLFYNFYSNYKRCYQIEEEIGFPLDYFGCSIIAANFLKQYFPPKEKNEKGKPVIPSFEDLHPYTAFTFPDFFKDVQNMDGTDFLNAIGYSEKNVHYYSNTELQNDKLWEDMAPLPAIGFIIDDAKEKAFKESLIKKSQPFNPRYRLVLPRKRRQGILITYS
jgi:hypothetical protein